ncbi:hypothetical protein [Deinococcus marmoris]|uniref:Uncharacterized protein n=1 Tax=Deinococcus marmoris TaxID=249408 RepID=A0A1U7NU07_9DEIO|nr:hypothetical protein [Deinococcus marmoris]OLV16387.1 hypothetical protein BOO71_0012070 [Deinococcus marmoris]
MSTLSPTWAEQFSAHPVSQALARQGVFLHHATRGDKRTVLTWQPDPLLSSVRFTLTLNLLDSPKAACAPVLNACVQVRVYGSYGQARRIRATLAALRLVLRPALPLDPVRVYVRPALPPGRDLRGKRAALWFGLEDE